MHFFLNKFQINDVMDGLGAEVTKTNQLALDLQVATTNILFREPKPYDHIFIFLEDVLGTVTSLSKAHSHLEDPPFNSEVQASKELPLPCTVNILVLYNIYLYCCVCAA